MEAEEEAGAMGSVDKMEKTLGSLQGSIGGGGSLPFMAMSQTEASLQPLKRGHQTWPSTSSSCG